MADCFYLTRRGLLGVMEAGGQRLSRKACRDVVFDQVAVGRPAYFGGVRPWQHRQFLRDHVLGGAQVAHVLR
ncbi:MAG: hypothetical protein GEU86_13580 [Actinophytocola sp.]|nr:hypothetical protein [Actinophytocola sp.]